LSATPALAAFGGTLLVGIAVSWWLTPLLMPPPSPEPDPASTDAE
jgi:predicted exporter